MNISIKTRLAYAIIIAITAATSPTTAFSQTKWKGFDITRTTDVFEHDVPIGTYYIIVEEYGANKSFGKIKVGELQKRSTYTFDEHGYYTNDGEYIYSNTYNSNGLIEQRELKRNNKLSELWTYKYIVDEKGPGVAVRKYDANGEHKSSEAWQGNNYLNWSPEGELSAKLNKTGKATSQTFTDHRIGMQVEQTITYNSYGYLKSSILVASFGSQTKNYSDYTYNEKGLWTERYSDSKLEKRQIFTKAEYTNFLEKQRQEEERQRQEEIARRTSELKQKIQSQGFALTEELLSKPKAKVELLSTAESKRPTEFEVNIPNKPETKEWNSIFKITIEKPAQIKYPDESTEAIPSIFSGRFQHNWLKYQTFSKPVEVKLKYNKKTNDWHIKNDKELISKHNISTMDITALEKYITDYCIKNAIKPKKIYLSSITQLQVLLNSSSTSAIFCNLSKTFPIRFEISESITK